MWRDSCEIIFACVRSPVHMSKTLPGKLLKATGFMGMLIVAVRCCYLRCNRKEIFRLHAQSSRVSTAFKHLLPCELLRNSLPCGVLRQFLLAFLKRSVLYNALHYVIDTVYAMLLHVPRICFGVFDYGEVKRTFVS